MRGSRLGVLAADLAGAVGRRVVADHEPEVRERLGQERLDRVPDEALPVVDGQGDGDERLAHG